MVKQITFLLFALVYFSGCKNDLEKVHAIAETISYPTLSGKNAQITFSDSGKLQITITTRQLNHYTLGEEPYFEFPEGIFIEFYDSAQVVESTISANYAKYLEEQGLWVARDSVVAKNLKQQEELNSQELFWDSEEKRIYSDKFTSIKNADGTFVGEYGFESNQDLTRWKLKGSKGSIKVKDE